MTRKIDTLCAIDPELVEIAVSGSRFQKYLFSNGKKSEIVAFVKERLACA